MERHFKFSQSLKDFFELDTNDLPYYVRFQIIWRETGEILDEIITNRSGAGRWVYDDSTGMYRQIRGTCQFGIPRTIHGIRKLLKRDLAEQLTEASEMRELTETERKAARALNLEV